MVILTDTNGIEISPIRFTKFDCDLNDTMDFELTLPASEWSADFEYGGRVFIPGTEYGGIIGGRKTETASDTVIITGRGWRGMLFYKVIVPPTGQAYKTVSGDLHTVLADLISEAGISNLFSVPSEAAGVSVTNYQFDRYITLLDGIYKMLKSVGYRLELEYVETVNAPGYIKLSAVEAEDYSDSIELSQDNRLNFTFEEQKNGVNHLICLGKGELTERVIIDLYIQQDGSIGSAQHYTGVEEVTQTYENTSAETEADLTEKGTEELEKLTSKQTFKMDVETLDIEAEIGDTIGGRDYITGMSMNKPVINKIYTEQDGKISKEYILEGDEQ